MSDGMFVHEGKAKQAKAENLRNKRGEGVRQETPE